MGTSRHEAAQCCRAKLGKKVLWSLEEETSCIKDLWQLPIIPWNGKTPTAATAAAGKATAGGDATAPTDGVLEAVKKVQQQQTHGEEIGSCPTCLETKFSKFPFNSATGPAKTPLALVHMDVVGPTRAPSLSGSRYFLTIVDDHTRAVWVYPLKSKGEEKRGKLEASGRWGVHLGIAKDHKGWLLWDLTTQKLTVSRDVKFLESLYYKEWKQQQQKLPSTPLIVEADELQQPSRQVEVAVSEEEMSGVTEEGGAAEVEQQQQQHESPPRVPHPPERPRRDVRPPVRLTYGGRGKPNVVQAGSVVEQIEEDEIAHCYWAPIPEPKTREEALNGPNGEKWKAMGDSDRKLFHSMVGSLNYAANHTRPDIAFATSRLASVVSRPSHEQLEAAKRLVRYVSATASVGLEYSGVRQRLQRGAADVKSGEMLLSCYTDASFNSGMKLAGMSVH
ncbi:hypothetical protein CLOM_g22691 [Closterium sp. NIES-68]|nr:hypothetical protein CLOM_g22691 [Closterium sp. NIES-68]